jgi:hypothetical protein
MKRNSFGINLDEGIALTTEKEFELLYVETHPEERAKLSDWLKTGNKPLILGGQIGCGKTTLIQQVFKSENKKPDLVFHFDKNSLDLSVFDAWLIILIEIFEHFDLNEFQAELPEDFISFFGNDIGEQKATFSKLKLEKMSLDSLKTRHEFLALLKEFENSLNIIIKRILSKLTATNELILFASGIDKFKIDTAEYISLIPILECLNSFKTLFEVNAVHLFAQASWINKSDFCLLTSESEQEIKRILAKRLGKYKQAYIDDIILICKFSGGNPRQAIRLMDYFLTFHKKEKNNAEAFLKAVKSLNRDIFAFSPQPSNQLLKQIQKDGFLRSSMVALPGDHETALKAVFGNWILIGKYRDTSTWKATLNPLIKDSLEEDFPEDPGIKYLKEYASLHGISDFGLNFDQNSEKAKCFLISELELAAVLLTHFYIFFHFATSFALVLI